MSQTSQAELYQRIADKEARSQAVLWLQKAPPRIPGLSLPRGVKLLGYSYVTNDGKRVIEAKKPHSLYGLWAVLHEIGHHYHRHHQPDCPGRAPCEGYQNHVRDEYQASSWAFETMRRNGIQVPVSLINQERRRIQEIINSARAAGFPIDRTAEHWANEYRRAA